jgi:3-oxoacyl-[acyl-carrier protein] reductase
MLMLDKKVALITGSTKGIGLATAKRFAQEGAEVIITGRSIDKLLQASQGILNEQPNARITTLELDVGSEESVKNAFQYIFKKFKRLDVLVSNAGILDDALIGMVTKDQINNVFSPNTFGVIYCAQYASRLMSRNKQGSIINLSSIIGVEGNIGQTVYAGSKAAVIGITKSLAKELAHQNIRVNAIAPGFIDTDMARSIGPEKYAERVASIKMGRAGTPEEIANVALFLASDLSSYVTGQIIGVDGGMLI